MEGKKNVEVRVILEVEDLDSPNTNLWTISFTRSIFFSSIYNGLARASIRKFFEKAMRLYFLRKLQSIEKDYEGY